METARLSLVEVETHEKSVRHIDTPHTAQPRIAILGHAPFTSIVTNAGGGETRYGEIVLNRWRSDPTLDDYGQWCYINDITTTRLWSGTYQPLCTEPEWYHVAFHSDRAIFRRRDGDIETETEIMVSPATASERRTIRLTNDSERLHEIELTSYGEIVITSGYADRHHPAFQNLFVQTEWLADRHAILAMRRPRSSENKPVWLGHTIGVSDAIGNVSCETDRARFIGRGRSPRNPAAMDNPGQLSGRVGAVLDPVFAIRARVSVPARESIEVSFTTFVSASREDAVERLNRQNDFDPTQEALQFDGSDEGRYQDLAGALLFPETRPPHHHLAGHASPRAPDQVPVLLASTQLLDGVGDARDLIKAQRYLEQKGFPFRLVILAHGQQLVDKISHDVDAERSVSVLRSDSLDGAALAALQSSARLIVECDGSGIGGFIGPTLKVMESPRARRTPISSEMNSTIDDDGLRFFNGIGGFNDNDEYEMRLEGSALPPAPWINVIANAAGGFTVSEAGAGSTWIASGSSFRLTPWTNDPVRNTPGECLYLRDEDSGALWTPTPFPIRDRNQYTVRHGAGYSMFEHERFGIRSSLRLGMAPDDPVKLQVLTLTNTGDRPRRITVTSYVEWVLGTIRERTRFDVQTSFDRER